MAINKTTPPEMDPNKSDHDYKRQLYLNQRLSKYKQLSQGNLLRPPANASLFAVKRAAQAASKSAQQSQRKELEKKMANEAGRKAILTAMGSFTTILASILALIYLNIHWFLSSMSHYLPEKLKNFFVQPKLWQKAVIAIADILSFLIILFIIFFVIISSCIISSPYKAFFNYIFNNFPQSCFS